MRKYTTPKDADITRPDWLDDIMPADMSRWLPGKDIPYGASRLTAKVRSSAQGTTASGMITIQRIQPKQPRWMGGDGRPRGGKRDAKAADRKALSATRLAQLMSGQVVVDQLKVGNLTTQKRVAALKAMVHTMDRRIWNLPTDASVEPSCRLFIWRELNSQREALVDQLMGILGDVPGVVKPDVIKLKAPVFQERCSKCNRLVHPPKGVFGCMCK